MASSSPKRRRIDTEDEFKLEDDDDNYVPYVPVAQRRQAKLAQLANRGQTRATSSVPKVSDEDAAREAREDAEREEERRRERFRKERTLLEEAQEVHKRQAEEGEQTVVAYMSHGIRSLTPSLSRQLKDGGTEGR